MIFKMVTMSFSLYEPEQLFKMKNRRRFIFRRLISHVLIMLTFILAYVLSPCLAQGKMPYEEKMSEKEMVEFKGKLTTDFSQYTFTGGGKSSWRGGMRCDLESGRLFLRGLKIKADMKYRYYSSQWKSSLKSIYELSLSYNPSEQGIYLKGGRFNLYDLSGIGQLDGGAAGWSFSKDFLAGLYLGSEPNLLEIDTDPDYQKSGLFFHYGGLTYAGLEDVKTIFSYNQITYKGLLERRFLYGQAFFTLWKKIYNYQQIEYEIGPLKEKHVTRLYLNGRFEVTKSVSLAGSYYSGHGYDYHRMILEKIKSGQQPGTQDLEPFYWYQDLGCRISLRKGRQRLSGFASLARREMEGEIFPRYGGSYSIDNLAGGRVGTFIHLSQTREKSTLRNMFSFEINNQLCNWLNLGFSYSNYTFKLIEQTMVAPPDSSEYAIDFSVRMNSKFFIYGDLRYISEDQNCLQSYLSLVYRL